MAQLPIKWASISRDGSAPDKTGQISRDGPAPDKMGQRPLSPTQVLPSLGLLQDDGRKGRREPTGRRPIGANLRSGWVVETASRYHRHCFDHEHQAVSNAAGTQAFPACGDALAAVVPGYFVVAAGRLYE